MSNRIKPWSNHRQILWAIGVFGLLFWAFGLFMLCTITLLGPGSQSSPPDVADLFGVVLCSVPYIYYIVVAHRAWTRKLWFVGVVIHCLMLILILISMLQYHGRSLVALADFPYWTGSLDTLCDAQHIHRPIG